MEVTRCCLVFLVLLVSLVASQQTVTVQTANGAVRGFESNGINYFLGVPFAAPPVGNLRWRPPQPVQSWSGIRDALNFGPACVQARPSIPIPGWNVSEDCLYLNVYAPAGAANLPVMVWIYGGSFVEGEGAFYDGSSLINIQGQPGGVIVVNMNYRMGPFGFLSLPELKSENPRDRTTGLYGIQDQRAALQWVKTNIARFGGNPNDVTLFGESAGAISTCIHVAAPRSQGFFHRALLESGFCNIWPLDISAKQGGVLADTVGCNRNATSPSVYLQCLRSKDANTIFHALPSSATWFPVVDGTELTQQPIDYLESGQINVHNGLVLGVNKNEYSLFACSKYGNINATAYVDFILYFFGVSVGKQVLQLYPLTAYPNPPAALVDVFSDLIFKCPSKYMADAVSGHGISTYFYSFQHLPGWAVNEPCLGVAHSFELPFIFPSTLPAFQKGYNFTAQEVELSQFMRTSWTSFAKTNSPNFGGNSFWPYFQQSSSDFIILNYPASEGHNLLGSKCPFWRKHQCVIGAPRCDGTTDI